MNAATAMVPGFTPTDLNGWVSISTTREIFGNHPNVGSSGARSEKRTARRTVGRVVHGLASTGRISLERGTQHPGCVKSFPGVTPLEPSLEKFGFLEDSKEISLGNTWGESALADKSTHVILKGPNNTRGKQDSNDTARAINFPVGNFQG